jgi:hypothetical protein
MQSSNLPEEIILPSTEDMPQVVEKDGICYERLEETSLEPDTFVVDGEFDTCVECESRASERASDQAISSAEAIQSSDASAQESLLPSGSLVSGVGVESSALAAPSEASFVSGVGVEASSLGPDAVSSGLDVDAVSSGLDADAVSSGVAVADVSSGLDVVSSGLDADAVSSAEAGLESSAAPSDVLLSSGAVDVSSDVSLIPPQASQAALYVPCASSAIPAVSSAIPEESSDIPAVSSAIPAVSSAAPTSSEQEQSGESLVAVYVPCPTESSTAPHISSGLLEDAQLSSDPEINSSAPDEISSVIQGSSLAVDPSSHLSSAQAAVDTGTSDCSACSFPSVTDLPISVTFSDGCGGSCGIFSFPGTEAFTLIHQGGLYWSGIAPSFDVFAELDCVSNVWRLTLFIGGDCVDVNWCTSGFTLGTVIELNCDLDTYPQGTVQVPMRLQSETPGCGTTCGTATVVFA